MVVNNLLLEGRKQSNLSIDTGCIKDFLMRYMPEEVEKKKLGVGESIRFLIYINRNITRMLNLATENLKDMYISSNHFPFIAYSSIEYAFAVAVSFYIANIKNYFLVSEREDLPKLLAAKFEEFIQLLNDSFLKDFIGWQEVSELLQKMGKYYSEEMCRAIKNTSIDCFEFVDIFGNFMFKFLDSFSYLLVSYLNVINNRDTIYVGESINGFMATFLEFFLTRFKHIKKVKVIDVKRVNEAKSVVDKLVEQGLLKKSVLVI